MWDLMSQAKNSEQLKQFMTLDFPSVGLYTSSWLERKIVVSEGVEIRYARIK